MTNQRVPRWFTEGMAVHEETAASPEWGDRLSPDVIMAIKNKQAAAGGRAGSRIRPSDDARAGVVSYFQAGTHLRLHHR